MKAVASLPGKCHLMMQASAETQSDADSPTMSSGNMTAQVQGSSKGLESLRCSSDELEEPSKPSLGDIELIQRRLCALIPAGNENDLIYFERLREELTFCLLYI